MNIQFNIHYKTDPGEIISIEYYFMHAPEKKKIANFYTFDGENWSGRIELEDNTSLAYNYIVQKNNTVLSKEWGKPRVITSPQMDSIIRDQWRARDHVSNIFLTSAFTQAVLKRKSRNLRRKAQKKQVANQYPLEFRLIASTIDSSLCFGITGNIPELGEWKKPVMMDDHDFPSWSLNIMVNNDEQFIEYKYVITDPNTRAILIWEEGDNRKLYTNHVTENTTKFYVNDDGFRQIASWRGAGVAIPVFSLRSHVSMGIGEFSDLKILAEWAHLSGLKVIQILPVNDTIATKTWKDSYPYAAISVFALNPLYIHIPGIAAFEDKEIQSAYEEDLATLNKNSDVNFEKVLTAKFKYLRILFDQEYQYFKKDSNVSTFIKENNIWLRQYAAFCHLRDVNGSVNYTQWPKYNTWTKEIDEELNSTEYVNFKEIEFYYFIQYHAERQLREVRDYARDKGIMLKGDLPIGIFRYSCDAWVAPELYNMDGQAGAPPDDFAVLGQNWGFPTYNWQEMATSNFDWWQKRMQQLNKYFDALRLDHILGFFRIWEIPTDEIQGTMGLFNPRLPYSTAELNELGLTENIETYTRPFITEDRIRRAFGTHSEQILKTFFNKSKNTPLTFKPEFANQVQIRDFINAHPEYRKYLNFLLEMRSDILLLTETKDNQVLYNPRITLSTTYAYSQLDHETKLIFDRIYNDYYFSRHDAFWEKQAYWKLPAIIDASDMLICGEDLGMIPHSVPGVMKALDILSLEIQRMPKGNTEFGIVQHYPYMSVCSPSSHDMPTIRGWWEADPEMAARFFHTYLHWFGIPPKDCTPDIVKAVVDDHLSSPSMLAIFPIQDLIGMDGHLRNPYAGSEQINIPEDPNHYWKFRFHMPVEQLMEIHGFNDMLRAMLKVHGR